MPPSNGTDTFLTIDDGNHGAFVWIAVFLSLGFSSVITISRLFFRSKNFWLDDWVITAALLVSWASCFPMFVALVHGLGKSVELVNAGMEGRQATGLRAFQVLVLIALALVECSVILFIHRVFTTDFRASGLVIKALHASNVLWTLVSIVVMCAGCSETHIFAADAAKCPGDDTRWKAVYAVSIVLDLAVAIIPVWFITLLHKMAWWDMLIVSIAFLARLAVIPPAILFMVTYSNWADTGRIGVGLALPIIYQLCHLGCSLITASIPCMRRIVRVYSKEPVLVEVNYWVGHVEQKFEDDTPPTSQGGPNSRSGFALPCLNRSSTSTDELPLPPKARPLVMNDPSPDSMKLRPEKLEST